MLLIVPFAAIFLSALTGFAALRAGRPERALGLAGLLVALAGWALWQESAAAGLEVLVHTLFLWGAVVPGLVALAIGAALGWAGTRLAAA
ncbi:hypothetical protein [Pseudoponticoccus marisrubri]|uniref:Uncharacterized protein n=1 Tax=Pseudoponticoccus marisrubri TaxID=1685382 RepID=A0A0W7WF18_9RHOB|nr:hypothetical protein [Pseudoponticoccus marisrubri]KUF09157.1 hypothetical protein AVJ23_18955 [Pseudoponticoccus marisrubri]